MSRKSIFDTKYMQNMYERSRKGQMLCVSKKSLQVFLAGIFKLFVFDSELYQAITDYSMSFIAA